MEATQGNLDSGCDNHTVSTGLSNQFADTPASVDPATTTSPNFKSYCGLATAYPQNKRPNNQSDVQFQDSVKYPGSNGHLKMQVPSAADGNLDIGSGNHAVSTTLGNQFSDSSASVHPTTKTAPKFNPNYGLAIVYPKNKRPNPNDMQFQDSIKHTGSGGILRTQAPDTPAGVSNCYVFKSRLQEYAQKVGLSTPTYETIREGPSHEPYFRSTVTVGGARYDSLIGFYNRKAAEQSAAEVALRELSASGEKKESISVPLHETGLCKNVLQEYAQKMNYAIPTYVCKKDDSTGRTSLFSCTVDIGGIQYIGAAARSKKEAEIKAARTALLAIQWSEATRDGLDGKTNYTVVPCKRKVPEMAPPQGEALKPKKSKKARSRKKSCKNMNPIFSGNQIQAKNMAICANDNDKGILIMDQNVQAADNGQSSHCQESAGQVNGSTSLIAHTREPVHALGSVDTCQLTDCPQQGDVNTGLGDSIASLSGAVGHNGSTNVSPMNDAPISSQLLSDRTLTIKSNEVRTRVCFSSKTFIERDRTQNSTNTGPEQTFECYIRKAKMEKYGEKLNDIVGSTGTISFNPSKQGQDSVANLTGNVHHLPCCVKYTGPTHVSHYFKPKLTGMEVDGLQVEEAYFRGRKLQGVSVPVPEGYKGFILGKNISNKDKMKKTAERCEAPEISNSSENSWEMLAKCSNITFWNHDSLPSQDDACLRLFHLFAVAKAMHEPLTAEELEAASVF